MTVIKHKEQRVGVFIDTQNLYHSARNLYNARVNFGAVLKEIVAGRKLVRAVAYVITTEAGDEKNFFEALTKLGIETKTKDLQVFHTGTKKADWDVGFTVDVMRMASRLDAVIIVSGDGDFHCLIEYLRKHNKIERIIIPNRYKYSSLLRKFAPDMVFMNDLKVKLEYK